MAPEKESSLPSQTSFWLGVLLLVLPFGVWFLSKLRAPTQDVNESVPPQDNTTPKYQERDSNLAIASKIPPTPTQHYQPDRRKYDTPKGKKWTEIIAVGVSVGLLGINILLWFSTKKAANAAKQSADITWKQLEMSERPWVITEYAPSAPLKFTSDGSATFEIVGKATNIGHSVALHVHDTPLIMLQENSIEMLHPTVKQKEVCDRMRDMGEKYPSGDPLFPNQASYYRYPLKFSRDAIEKARIGKTDVISGLVIIGCVDYAFSFSPKHHQTGYVYEIVKAPPSGQIGASPIKIGQPLLPNQLLVRRSLFGGFYAD